MCCNRDRDQYMYFPLSHHCSGEKSFLNIYVFHCYAWAFSSCGECGPLFFVGPWPLIVMASFTVENRFEDTWASVLVAPGL